MSWESLSEIPTSAGTLNSKHKVQDSLWYGNSFKSCSLCKIALKRPVVRLGSLAAMRPYRFVRRQKHITG